MRARLDIFKKSQTKKYTDPKDAKMDFEKAKRQGAEAELADTMKDCKTAEKEDCEDVAKTVFAEAMGLAKGDSTDFKAKYALFKKDAAASAAVKKTSACAEEAGEDKDKLAECATLAKKEAATALGWAAATEKGWARS